MTYTRPHKGKSLIDFPSSYVIIDIETTGLSPMWDEIIEISALRIENENIAQTFNSLVKPSGTVSEFIEDLTGISNELLADAPKPDEVIPLFEKFIGSDIIVGHNVNFDINFLYDSFEEYLNKPLENNFIDTMRIFKKLYPDVEHHTLSDLAYQYSIKIDNAHRALDDCNTTFKGYVELHKDVLSKFQSINDFVQLFKPKRQKYKYNPNYHTLRSSDIVASTTDFDEESPLYNKVFVFTGVLEKMSRKEAMQLVADHGGINGDGITKKTNYLVLGNNDYCSTIKDGKSTKQKKPKN